MTRHIGYEQSGVNYGQLDPFKVLAQEAAVGTADNLDRFFGYTEVHRSRGESAYVWDVGNKYEAIVTEGLGTKNLVADAMRGVDNQTYYRAIAQDTIAMIVNDLITVGAMPKVVTAHFSVGSSEWFNDDQRNRDLVQGWVDACNQSGVVWGPGETPALKGVLQPNAIELSGTAVGEIYPKNRLILGDKLCEGDSIILIESSGIHANGATLAREIEARKARLGNRILHSVLPWLISDRALPKGYLTELADGTAYGRALLEPTIIYVNAVRQLFDHGIDIHYMSNITGHGWRKLMRANRELSYVIHEIPTPQPVFNFIQEQSGNTEEEMYGNFNMGAGFAIYVNKNHAASAVALINEAGYKAENAGIVYNGPKQVVIEPKNIVFGADKLQIR